MQPFFPNVCRKDRLMRVFVKAVAVLLVSAVVGGCSMLNLPDQRGQLVGNVQDFTQRLRWLDINGAADYFEKDPGNRFREMFAEADDLHIVDVRVIRVDMTHPDSAMVNFEYQYYELPSVTVQTRKVEQEWILDNESGRGAGEWKIASDFPDRLQGS